MDYVKRESIAFTHLEDATKEHKQLLNQLNNLRKKGDFSRVAEILGMNMENVRAGFGRINSKHHYKIVECLDAVIDSRIKLTKEYNQC